MSVVGRVTPHELAPYIVASGSTDNLISRKTAYFLTNDHTSHLLRVNSCLGGAPTFILSLAPSTGFTSGKCD